MRLPGVNKVVKENRKTVYVSHPASGLARSNFPLETHVSDDKIIRSLPFHIPDDIKGHLHAAAEGSPDAVSDGTQAAGSLEKSGAVPNAPGGLEPGAAQYIDAGYQRL